MQVGFLFFQLLYGPSLLLEKKGAKMAGKRVQRWYEG